LGYQSANDRPVFATIGLRNQGRLITRKSFPYADFAALVDVDSQECSATTSPRWKRPPAASLTPMADYRQVLDRKDIDAVMIATPDHWHTKIAIEAMAAGKDVYCEKPLTLTIDEGKQIERAVERTGRVFQVGTMQRASATAAF
jgi:predicted dehydrogenase